MKIADYYRHPDVRARMEEFLGGASTGSSPCPYITTCDSEKGSELRQRAPGELPRLLSQGLDVSRSLWDRDSLIAHLDLEYVNFDFPAEAYLDPLRTFSLQQPVVEAAQRALLEYGIAPLHLLSGRGHHLVWRIDRDSEAFHWLAGVAHLPGHLQRRYASVTSPDGSPLPDDVGRAFSGLGRVMEFLAHRILDGSSEATDVPLELTAVSVGPGQRGREMVSIDISEYGDPLDTRAIRIPFSIYRKPWVNGQVLQAPGLDQIPYLVVIPLHEMELDQGLLAMRAADTAAELAGRASVQIPDQSGATERLIRSYEQSNLARFHDRFYETDHDPADRWPRTYDRAPLHLLPACIRRILERPNDLLLKPAGIRQVVVALMAKGWHPRHIAGLVRSKYERDHGWGDEWFVYDAATRADFYVRMFAGLIETGRDELVHFSCRATKERGFCFQADRECRLEELGHSLMEEVTA